VQPPHRELSTYGLMREFPAQQLRTWVDECLAQEIITRTDGSYPVLKLTPEGWGVLRKERSVELSVAQPPPVRSTGSRAERISKHRERVTLQLDADSTIIFEALRALRTRIAKGRKLPAYVIMHDTTLFHIAQARPSDLEELAGVPGLGEARLRHYGPQILDVIRNSTGG